MLIELIAAGVISWAIAANKTKEKSREKLRLVHLSRKFSDRSIVAIQTRSQQLKEISGNLVRKVSPKEQSIEFNLIIATATLGITGIGALLHSPIALLGLPGILYNSKPYFKDAYKILLIEKRLGIRALDAIVITGCIATGFYFAAAVSNFGFYVSRKLLLKTEDLSKRTLTNVFGELPSHAWVARTNNVEAEVPLDSIRAGDTIVVTAGNVIPIDGIIIDGHGSIDQHMLTGESQPAEKEIGNQVLAATMVLSGKIYIRVDKAGKDTVVSKIAEILEQTVNFKTSVESRGELIADKSAAVMLALGAIALPIIGMKGAIAVINSNFGVNMRTIAPFATLTFLTIASRQGILVKDGRVFESLDSIDTVVFDKTGTLTIQEPHVGKIHSFGKYSEDELLAIAASLEQRQSHPMAKALQREAKDRKLEVYEKSDTHYEVGYGLQVRMNNQIVLVGSERFMIMKKITLTKKVKDIQKEALDHGHSMIMVAIDNKIVGVIELHATVRHEVNDVVKMLQLSGMHLHIISGDQEPPTKKLAEDLGIDHYHANTLPENKAKIIEQLQKEGRSVCFVGDGINDSIALKQADVSVSLRGASTAAIDTAQVILMDGNLTHLTSLFGLAKEYERNISRSFLMTLIPGTANICCAFFLSSGVILSVILDRVGQFTGIANGVLPLLKNSLVNRRSASALVAATDNTDGTTRKTARR